MDDWEHGSKPILIFQFRSTDKTEPNVKVNWRSVVDDGAAKYTRHQSYSFTISLFRLVYEENERDKRTMLSTILSADNRDRIDCSTDSETISLTNRLRVWLGNGERFKV